MTNNSLSPAHPYSSEFCEREYNARLAVPEHKDFFVRWASRSAIAREQLSGYLDFAYGPGPKQSLDFFPASSNKPIGLLVFIHGGYWRTLDKADFSFVAEPFVKAQVSVAAINYSLCPAVEIADIVRECRSAIAWLHANTSRFDLNGKPIVIAGHSAGGHLAAMMIATQSPATGGWCDRIAGAVAVSGLFDLEPLVHTSMNADLRLNEESAKAVSPVYLLPQVMAPILLVGGGAESAEFQRQNRLLKNAWPKTCSSPAVIPGRHHFSTVDYFADPASHAFRDTMLLFG